MIVNYYYSVRVQETIGYEEGDDDSLLQLCRSCAAKHAADVQFASRGDEENECEFCGAANDPHRKVELDVLYLQFVSDK